MNDNTNNNNQNNGGLNVVSLGNVDGSQNLNVPINDIPPVAPLEPNLDNVETLDEVMPNEGVISNEINQVQPVQGINSIPNMEPVAPVAPVEPINDIPNIIDNTPIFNDIGTIPPISNIPEMVAPVVSEELPPKKKGMNKTLFVVIIILALAAVGAGVYILLNKTNGLSGRNKVTLKALKIEIGSQVSTNIKDYATFKGINSANCSLDTSNITDTSKLNAEYNFKIVCNNKTYTGKAVIVDTIAPKVTVKDEVTVNVNGTVNPEDFISECSDDTECTYEFKDSAKVQEYLKTAASYYVPIIAKDESGNESEVTGTLIVSEEVSTVALVCSITSNGVLETNKFGLAGGEFNKTTIRTYTFTFDDKDEYDKLKNDNSSKSVVTYQNITGSPKFDDDNKTLTLTKNLTYEELNKEVNSTLPLPFGELKSFYENRNYECKIGY